MSAYRIAIDQTTNTIDQRAWYFRNLVVGVVVLGLGSIGWAAVTWRFSPLVGLLLLIPTCGLFFFFDGRLLRGWRSRLLDAWVKKEIEFRSFCEAINTIATLPKNTLQTMLATLPSAGDLVTEQRISPSTREAATLTTTMHACESDAMALKTIGLAIVSGSLIIAVIFWMWQPILGSALLPLFPLVQKWLRHRRLAVLRKRIAAARAKPDFDDVKYGELVANLPLRRLSLPEKPAFVSSATIGESNPHVLT